MAGPQASSKIYLGIEISTQQAKIIAIDDALKIIYEDTVQFDTAVPEFRTHGGVHMHDDGLTVTVPTLMWVKAVDLILDRTKKYGLDFSKVVAISGTGQQHGSVYWKEGAKEVLSNLQPDQPLHLQLQEVFSVTDSPIWMDSSTTEQCKHLEHAVGGAKNLADITGARAYERHTGNQIAKIYQTKKADYDNTERISLVSSFGACLFIGDYAPIDESDGSGMNLLDIRSRDWSQQCLDACAPRLREKLGTVVPSSQCIGDVSSYMVDRYGFSPECKVIAFTGDNPASVAGMRLQRGDVVVSLGTSDTLFLWLDQPKPALQGNILVNPVDSSAYMAMLVYKNGSLVREKIRDRCAGGSWEQFESCLKSTPRGNGGNIGMYFDVQEITPPHAPGEHRFNKSDQKQDKLADANEIRALIEGQFMAKRVHAESLGYTLGPNSRVLATGGASSNQSILQVLADIFNAPVYTQEVANSACLGCAYRAKHGWLDAAKTPFEDVVKAAPQFVCAASPNEDADEVYTPLTTRYKMLEDKVMAATIGTMD